MRKPFICLTALTIIFLSFSPFLNLAKAQVTIINPLKWDTIEELINAIINFLWAFALVVVPIVIVIAGYFFVTSMGDPAKVSQAKKMVLYALIGLLVIGFSKGIIAVIQEVLKRR